MTVSGTRHCSSSSSATNAALRPQGSASAAAAKRHKSFLHSWSSYSDKYAEGRVIGYKNHQVGDTVEYGTNITIIVSKGKEPTATTAP